MRKKQSPVLGLAFIVFSVLFLLFLGIRFLFVSPSSQARSTVEQFYSLEQEANFSGSWDLLHPFMKERFPKAAFIQDRSHVFIGHFGAETFKYEIGEPNEVEGWKPADGEKVFKKAFKFEVFQKYSGKYGKFQFAQDVYVVKYKKEWVILWDYN